MKGRHCGLQNFQSVTNMKRNTNLEFTAIRPILYIPCKQKIILYISLSNS